MEHIFVKGAEFRNLVSQKYNRHHPKINLALVISLVIMVFISAVLLQGQKTTQVSQPMQKTEVSKVSSVPSENWAIQAQKLEKYLTVQAALLGVSDNISYYFQDLTHNQNISLDSTRSWIPASTIKAYVAVEAFRQRNLGLIDFNQIITIKASNVVATELETDEFPRLREGTNATIKQLIEAMIVQSDNTAYNALLDILDRRNINSTLRNLGITETVVGEKLNLDSDQFQEDLQVSGRQPNTTTAKDLASLFSLLYSHKISNTEEILDVFKRQKINNMIPALLPSDVVVAHKTGDWTPIYHDGGIIYKPSNPFIFVAFTNSGNPIIIAKMAQVAYYQNPKYVGKSLSLNNTQQAVLADNSRPIYYLKNLPTETVLGESSDNKFPTLTAEDLGITATDLQPGENQIKNIDNALITPGSLLYGIKQLFENIRVNFSSNNSSKAQSYLNNAKDRLSEINTLSKQNDTAKIDQLLTASENSLKKAVVLASKDPNKDSLMIEVKRANDLHYAVLSKIGENIPDDKKEQFIDTVYNFYKKNEKEVIPALKSSIIVNPTQQKPTVGLVQEIKNNQIKLKLDDGTTKQVNIADATNVRSFDKETPDNLNSLKPGSTIAVLGSVGSDQRVIAQFILNNVPQELTNQRQGTVTEINPNQGAIKMVNQKGQVELIQIKENTSLKSKDTNVSLEGIKAGSQVSVYGVPQNATTASASPSPANPSAKPVAPTAAPKISPVASPIPPSIKTPQSTIKTPTIAPSLLPTVTIKATSVTIIRNNSGAKEEKIKPESSVSNQPAKPEPAQKQQAPPPQQPVNKPPTIVVPNNGLKDKNKK